jgi:hypothetical protein
MDTKYFGATYELHLVFRSLLHKIICLQNHISEVEMQKKRITCSFCEIHTTLCHLK